MATKEKIPEYMLKPFHVCHKNGDVIAGFDTLKDAQEDVDRRNTRAESFGVPTRYVAGEKK